jgi:hypothetical protein
MQPIHGNELFRDGVGHAEVILYPARDAAEHLVVYRAAEVIMRLLPK